MSLNPFDLITHPISDFWAGVSLGVLSLVLIVLGLAALVQALDSRSHMSWRDWHRWTPSNFSYWTGFTLIGCGTILGFIGLAVITDANDSPAWGVFLCVGTGFSAFRMFGYWSADRMLKSPGAGVARHETE